MHGYHVRLRMTPVHASLDRHLPVPVRRSAIWSPRARASGVKESPKPEIVIGRRLVTEARFD